MHKLRLLRTIIFMEVLSRPGMGGMYLLSSLLQPMALLGAVTVFFSLISQDAGYGGNIFIFLVTGLIPHFSIMQGHVRVQNSQNGWRGKKKIPGASPVDFILALALLETLIFFFTALILLFGATFFDSTLEWPRNIINIMAAFGLLALISAGIGSFNMSVIRFFPFWELVLIPFRRFMFFISGAFYVVDYVPVMLRDIVIYNPVAHCSMLVRTGYYGEQYPHMTMDIAYVLWWALGSLFIGLSFERLTRNVVVKKTDRDLGVMDGGW